MPDAELNRQCAEKIMGYTHDENGCWYSPHGTMGPESDLPYYVNDPVVIFGPGGVVETLRAREIYLEIDNYQGPFRVVAWRKRGKADYRQASAVKNSVCRAIVVAAIKAVGGDK